VRRLLSYHIDIKKRIFPVIKDLKITVKKKMFEKIKEFENVWGLLVKKGY